jgi:hypothetical protein
MRQFTSNEATVMRLITLQRFRDQSELQQDLP